MGCETTSYCKDIWGLGRVLPKIEEVIVDILGRRDWHPVLVATIPRDEFGDTILRYVFWAFAPCIEGFRHCKPVISIDGTHLYGKYR